MSFWRRNRAKLFSLALGVGVIIWGFNLATATDVSCGGETLEGGEVCDVTSVHNGSVSSGQFTAEEQLHRDHIIGPIIIGVGVLILALAVWVSYRSYLRRKTNTYARRKKLAATNGWTFQNTNPAIIRGTIVESARVVAGVLIGTLEGLPFAIFDIVNQNGRPETIWFAYLPDHAPDGLNTWIADGKREVLKTPGHVFKSQPRMLTETGALLNELNDKELLRPIQRLGVTIKLYLTDTAAPTAAA